MYYINVLTAITALCDCWGMTTPALVPDIGIMASDDIVAIERASIDAIKIEDLIPAGIPRAWSSPAMATCSSSSTARTPSSSLKALSRSAWAPREYELITVNKGAALLAYQSVRDGIVFTDKRIIAIDVQGLTGKKKGLQLPCPTAASRPRWKTAGNMDLTASRPVVQRPGSGQVRV